ncbi:hypothetical protein BHF71_02485 [Vulcanibacillus modesticaldus]|uniref:DsrE family protein n=1 Tax=Vulcanibacillus modesticaldus TaxID=337097 RepID=A0A1D2YTQ9_9BACI|nr:hypothetical protein [Vulcanibacillus modesticaldus]OEF99069.1 hypothetical protein BHF71_02485 [Vulcanibacillus modesticaldus]
MSSKVVIIISTGEKEKALTGMMYAANALKNKWLDDVKVVFFGPSEKLISQDQELQELSSKILKYQTPVACKFISDNEEISNDLEKLGYRIDYVGALISDFIKEGYIPIVF